MPYRRNKLITENPKIVGYLDAANGLGRTKHAPRAPAGARAEYLAGHDLYTKRKGPRDDHPPLRPLL